MASGNLRAWLDGEREKLVWIEFDEYAHKVFAGQSEDWLRVANVFVSGVGQALAVIKTDVLSIDLLAPLLQEELTADLSPAERVQALLQLQPAKEFIAQVIDALAHRFGDQMDIVLKLPTPAQLLRRAGAEGEISFDDLDDVGIGLSNLVREFSSKPIAALLIASADLIGTEEAEALGSVTSAARHYGWSVGVSFDAQASVPDGAANLDADVVLFPNIANLETPNFATLSVPTGGGLVASFWQGGSEIIATSRRVALYGKIPADAQPEQVLARISIAHL